MLNYILLITLIVLLPTVTISLVAILIAVVRSYYKEQ